MRITLERSELARKNSTNLIENLSEQYGNEIERLDKLSSNGTLSTELQAYLKEVLKLRLSLLVHLRNPEKMQAILEHTISKVNHIDQIYIFLKAYKKKL